jgi:hypothetical protein
MLIKMSGAAPQPAKGRRPGVSEEIHLSSPLVNLLIAEK